MRGLRAKEGEKKFHCNGNRIYPGRSRPGADLWVPW